MANNNNNNNNNNKGGGSSSSNSKTTTQLPVSAIYSSNGSGSSSVNAEITVFVLLTGVLVGLLLVLLVLCICKCCLKPSKPQLKRQQVVFTKYSSERDVIEASDKYEEAQLESVVTSSSRRMRSPRRSPSSVLHLPTATAAHDERSSLKDVSIRQNGELDSSPLLEMITTFSSIPSGNNTVFPECSRETAHQGKKLGGGGAGGSSSSSSELDHFPLVSRHSGEEIIVYETRRFPRSPPIQRQSSVCLQMSDEHLDRYNASQYSSVGEGGGGGVAVALASPEGSSSLEGSTTERSSLAEVTRVSAEVHQIPHLETESTQSHNRRHHNHHLSPPCGSSAATLFSRCSTKGIPLSSRSLDDQVQTTRRQDSSMCSLAIEPSTVLLRPVSAYDIRQEERTPEIQHATSTEDGVLESMMETRCRENNRLLLVRRKGSLLSDEEDSEPRSKVRYNDTGSREEVNEEVLDMFTEDIDNLITPEVATGSNVTEKVLLEVQTTKSAEDQQMEAAMALQSKQLWELRATFEEDEQLSDTFRLEEMDSVDDDATAAEEPTRHCDVASATAKEDGCPPPSISTTTTECGGNLLTLPSYESRRQSYKNILSKRVKRLESSVETSTSVDNSFDSVETEESSTDASRIEAVTTSMESTTDNTDSTGEGQIHRLQQMKHDSGYKSLEATNGSRTVRKQIHFAVEDEGSIDIVGEKKVGGEEDSSSGCATCTAPPTTTIATSTSSIPITLGLPLVGSRRSGRIMRGIEEGGGGKTASKKRRDYTRERQVVETSFGTTAEIESGQESLDDGQGKTSVFLRFFRTNREQQQPQQQQQQRRSMRPFTRDFSIDEKSDTLFHEFSRRDPVLEFGSRCRSPRLHARHRLYHRHADGDGGTSSPGHTRTKLSPQDSIEEEQRSNDAEIDVLVEQHSINEIPIIKVAGEDSS